MSEKITFSELIESIAEETDNSKQFTHDFIRDFVEVINDGLEEDGSVNIAGFGKFKLRRVDERDGYNPQTEETITIPAHNKIVFKPYKDLRELINAPYAHMEPELIEKEEGKTQEASTDPQDSDQADFLPTAPPTSTEESQSEKDIEEEAPFDLDDKGNTASSDKSSEYEAEKTAQEDDDVDGDIVEFKSDETANDEINEELSKLLHQSKDEEDDDNQQQITENDAEDTDQNSEIEETLNQTEDLIDESDNLLNSIEEEEDDQDKESAPPSLGDHHSTRKKRSSLPTMIIAAGFILLLAAGGVWYFGLFPEEGQQEMVSQQISNTEELNTSNDQQNNQSADNQDSQNQQQSANQNQSQPTSSSTTATSSVKEKEDIEIQKGQTLWSLAEEKYGNPRLWPWIYGNNGSLQDPDLILAGNSLSVPLPSGPNNKLNSTDSVGVAKGYIATYRWYKDNNSEKAKNHLLGATVYHEDISNIADVQIDKADLSYANRAR